MEVNKIKLNYNDAIPSVTKYKTDGKFENNLINDNINLIYKPTDNSKNKGDLYYTNIPLKIFEYDESKFVSKNKTEFTQFVSIENNDNNSENMVSISDYNTLLDENEELNNTIADLIKKYENNDSEQMILAMKNEIIQLRIQLKQGSSETDFSEDFPYLPITK